MDKVNLDKNNNSYNYNDGYGRTYDRPSNLNEQKPSGYNSSGTLKERLQALTSELSELERQRNEKTARGMTDMMELLPKNSYDAQWVNDQNTDIKSIKRLMIISSFLIYGGIALRFGTILLSIITSTYHDNDRTNNIWGIICVIVGLIVFYLYSSLLNGKIKKCTVMVKGMIVSYKVSHSASASGGTTYTPVFGFNFNDQNYTVTGSLYSSGIPRIGKEVDLYIDAKDPTTYFQPQHDRSTLIFITLFSALFIGAGLMIFFV